MKTIKAIVHRIIDPGKHGPFVVVHYDGVEGSVTFSLSPDVWLENTWPELGSVVRLFDLRQKRAGWRATTARFWAPEDEAEEQLEKSRMIEEIIQYCEQFSVCKINPKILGILTQDLDFETLFDNIKALLDAPGSCDCEDAKCSYELGSIFMSKIKNENQALKLFRWQKELNLAPEDFLQKAIELKSSDLMNNCLAKINWEKLDLNSLLKNLSRLDKESILNKFAFELEVRAEEAVIDRFKINQYQKQNPDLYPNVPENGVYLEIENSYLLARLKIFELMVNRNMEIDFLNLRLEKLAAHIGFLSVRPNANDDNALSLTNDIKLRFKILYRHLNPPRVSNQGLDIVHVGERRIAYFEGQLVGDISQAYNLKINGRALMFEKHATFKKPEETDYVQQKTVYLWTLGNKEPKEIYSRHAKVNQGYLSLDAQFLDDEIIIKSNVGGLNREEYIQNFTLLTKTGL